MQLKEVLELIKTGEGYTLEFKKSFNNSIGKEICGLANASGGKILLGVNDNGQIAGIELTNSLKSQMQDIARNMEPSFHVFIEKVKNIAVVYISEGKKKPYFVHGQCYLRQGANSQKLKRDEIRDFFQKENLIQFDRKANKNFDMKHDFNNDIFKTFTQKAGIDNSLYKEHVLKNLGLITENKLNNAGVLFFTDKISRFFLNSIIGCVLYEDKTKTKILDKKEFDSDFVSNYNNAVVFALRNLRIEYVIEKIEREEKQEIPESVLREIIINAMIHRDYFSEGRVLIEIFSDRIEVSNPGELLFDKSELGKRSLARNPLLVDLVHRLKLVEKIGSGINRIRELMKGKVEFNIDSNWFDVVVKRNLKLSDSQGSAKNQPKTSQKPAKEERKKMIIQTIKENKFTKRGFAEEIGVNGSTVESDLKELKEEGKIQFVGPKRGGHWEMLD